MRNKQTIKEAVKIIKKQTAFEDDLLCLEMNQKRAKEAGSHIDVAVSQTCLQLAAAELLM